MGDPRCREGEPPEAGAPGHPDGPFTCIGVRKLPATLVTAVALTAVTGVANVLVGGMVLTLSLTGAAPDDLDGPGPMVLAVAWAYLILGCVAVIAAMGVSGRRHSSRLVPTVVMIVGMAVASLTVGLVDAWCSTGLLVGIVASWVGITLLWDSRANEYFHATPRQGTRHAAV